MLLALSVSKGYAQTHGIDYEDTFSSIVNMAIVRAMTIVNCVEGLAFHQMNVKNTLFHGDLQEEVYKV